MIDLNTVPETYQESLELLAAWQEGEGITIYSLDDPDQQVIRFVEVSRDFGDNPLARPFATGASRDFPFRSEVVLLSHHDWEAVNQGRLPPPEGWDWSRLRKIHSNGEA